MQKRDVSKQIEFYCEKDGNNICPFSHEKCKKIARSDLGICSFVHKESHQIICPNFFNQSSFLKIIATKLLLTDKYKIFKEVKVGNNFIDYLLVDSLNNNNYVAVEVQSLDTSGNYKWVFGEKVKPFCINWKTTKKTILSQLLTKVSLFKKNDKKVVLVIQDTFFDYLKFNRMTFDVSKDFHILSLHYDGNKITEKAIYSFSLNNLIEAVVENDEVDLSNLVNRLMSK